MDGGVDEELWGISAIKVEPGCLGVGEAMAVEEAWHCLS